MVKHSEFMRFFAILCALTVALSAAASTHAQGAPGYSKVAGKYHLILMVGPVETMSMANGNGTERMIGGKNATCHMGMSMYGLLAMSARSKTKDCNHHLELHVYDRKSGRTVMHAGVSISLQSTTGSHVMIDVPIMTMVGMKAKLSDYHYGNDIYAAPGKYNVHIMVNKVKVTFSNIAVMNGM